MDKKRFWWSIWVSHNRPRSGTVFEKLKDLKRKFRRISRNNIRSLATRNSDIINFQIKNKNMKAVWNKLKMNKKCKVKSRVEADEFAAHYSGIMSDDGVLNVEQLGISKFVQDKADQLKQNPDLYHTPVTSCQVTSDFILHAIKSLTTR